MDGQYSGGKCGLRREGEGAIGFRAKGREVTEAGEGFQLREEPADYTAFFQAQNDDMGPKNTFFWILMQNNQVHAVARPPFDVRAININTTDSGGTSV